MVILFLFALGIGNFALHKAVLESGHPVLSHMSRLAALFGGYGSLLLELALLVAAMLLVAGGQPAWAWAYLAYSAMNALAGWLILSRRV